MCGIVSVVGTIDYKADKVFKDLLILDSLRGEDSTGAAFITRQDETNVIKQVGDPFTLLDRAKFASFKNKSNKVIIGHNRWATTGKVNNKNAHPFDFTTIVGVHNGTLKNKYKLQDHNNYDTDSEALYHNIEIKGLRETIEDVEGAYALVWYNKVDNSINMLRNKERPLTFAHTKDKKLLLIASEAWMIRVAAERNGLELDTVLALPEDTHYSYTVPDASKEFDKAHIRGIKQKEPVRVFTHGVGQKSSTTNPKASNVYNLKEGSKKETPKLEGQMVRLKTVTYGKNAHGATYVLMDSPDHPSYSFRYYVKSEKECKGVLNHKFYIGEVKSTEISAIGIYFKLQYDSLDAMWDNWSVPIGAEDEVVVKDHEGNELTEAQFESRYSDCAWCSEKLEYETFVPFTHGDGLCPDCAKHDEVSKYIPRLGKSV
ncbi:MAG TPA: hypothetical protein VFM18_21845 [Methanosarcina sp.]|nr:hypothetical protein [Methanosarcina sp.]